MKILKEISVFVLTLTMLSCSLESDEQTELLTADNIIACGTAFSANHPSFDNEYEIDEDIVISWSALLCGGGVPDFISISFYKKGQGFIQYRSIASNLPFEHKTNPSFSYQNYIWSVNDYTIQEGEEYTMVLTNSETGKPLDYKDFTISGTNNNPPNCNLSVSEELDGDYRLRFYFDNNGDCFSNMIYSIDFGDGSTLNSTQNNDTFSIAHQYPFGTNALYNVTIIKNNATTGETLDTVYRTVRSKRD